MKNKLFKVSEEELKNRFYEFTQDIQLVKKILIKSRFKNDIKKCEIINLILSAETEIEELKEISMEKL